MKQKFGVNPLETVILLYNLLICEDRDSGADYTFEQMIQVLSEFKYSYDRDIVENALYCCNINHENGVFWHPFKVGFRTFAYKLGIKNRTKFSYRYNKLRDIKDASQT